MESTTSKFFRRVSSSMSVGSRKNSVPSLSPTRIEEGNDPMDKSTQKRKSFEVGDVNVQFPDNLVRVMYTICDLAITDCVTNSYGSEEI